MADVTAAHTEVQEFAGELRTHIDQGATRTTLRHLVNNERSRLGLGAVDDAEVVAVDRFSASEPVYALRLALLAHGQDWKDGLP